MMLSFKDRTREGRALVGHCFGEDATYKYFGKLGHVDTGTLTETLLRARQALLPALLRRQHVCKG